jgi:hypothetical protein
MRVRLYGMEVFYFLLILFLAVPSAVFYWAGMQLVFVFLAF